MQRYQMYIDGHWVDASNGAAFPSINPATEDEWALVPDATADDVDRAVRAAHRAFETGPWSRLSPAERGKALFRIAEAILPHTEHLGRTETTDTGKLLRETAWQAKNVAEIYTYYGGLADKIHGEIAPTGPDAPLSMVVREPLGVVAAIVPWNSQLQLAAFKIAPALAAGNTIVVKASEDASAALLEFARAVEAAGLPPGVFNVITGGARPCGETLVSHPLVRRVSFTGGVETARKIIPATAGNMARLSLELGGKSPVIVYGDADIGNAVNGATAAIFGASGQSCAAGSRLLVQAPVYDEMVGRLIERTKAIRIGDPLDPSTDMGPLATIAQRDRIERLLAQSVEQGAEVLHGGSRPSQHNRGYYFEPTIVACANQDLPIVRNELFGPVLSVLKFDDEEEAIAMARDSEFGFAGGVFSNDFPKAYRTARAIPAGRVWVNTYRVTSMMIPFGGFKQSGYGREAGIDAIRDYTDTKGLFIDLSGTVADPFVMR